MFALDTICSIARLAVIEAVALVEHGRPPQEAPAAIPRNICKQWKLLSEEDPPPELAVRCCPSGPSQLKAWLDEWCVYSRQLPEPNATANGYQVDADGDWDLDMSKRMDELLSMIADDPYLVDLCAQDLITQSLGVNGNECPLVLLSPDALSVFAQA